MSIEILRRQNPWWADTAAINEDPHLAEYDQAMVKWEPPLLQTLKLDRDLIYILLGPRQVGKTTFFKLLVRQLLLERNVHPRTILYLNCEALGPQTPQALAELLRDYILWAKTFSKERLYILLDEATYLKDWERGLKIVADEGKLKKATLIAAGSHAAGIRKGGERLPGRRGRDEHLDLMLLPLSFRRFLMARNTALENKLPIFENWNQKTLFATAQEIALWADQISSYFSIYLRSGGFPRSIRDEAEHGRVMQDVYKLYRDAFVGDLARLGRRESLLRELAQWLINRRENPFDWSDAARETQLGTHPTVREYVEDAEAAFLWEVLYKSKSLGESLRAPRSSKRVYFADPFSFHCFRSWVFGYDNAWRATEEFLADPNNQGYLVESVIASHLRRTFGDRIFYWRNGQEIDFVIFQQEKRSALIEVKYQAQINPDNAKALVQQGGGILLTKNQLAFSPKKKVLAIPVHYFLAMLEA
ncbi:MAG: ATP-binding protein [candidate division KSB1 bacterium]|nr:ATP-binding protein [candidate division KSB1 bacterium]MDZ7303844.1 ATP-binding protein [candidate division KSB1 bacterium]MDZ7312745.1 ATP-binding protein [candidate division KSB1 bacterium]